MGVKIQQNSTTGFIPSTFDENFHGSIESNNWLKNMPYRQLGKTGLDLSLLGYGGSSLAKFYGDEFTQNEAIDTIRESIKCGVNYIDTSPWYGDSEALLGQALKEVPRNTYYIGTKVGRNFTPGWENRFDFSRTAVLKNVEDSLSLLGVHYVDVIQIHDVEFCLDPKIILEETLPALESIVKAGKAKYIGITSYSIEVMKKIIEQSPIKIDTILSYARFNLHDTSLLNYLPFLENKGVGVINAAPVSMGLLTSRGPPPWHPASDEIKVAAKLAEDCLKTRGKTLEEVALGYGLRPQNPSIATTLVSMPTKNILNKNLEIVTTPRNHTDNILYDNVMDVIKKNVQGPGHWEGKEIAEYKNAIGIN